MQEHGTLVARAQGRAPNDAQATILPLERSERGRWTGEARPEEVPDPQATRRFAPLARTPSRDREQCKNKANILKQSHKARCLQTRSLEAKTTAHLPGPRGKRRPSNHPSLGAKREWEVDWQSQAGGGSGSLAPRRKRAEGDDSKSRSGAMQKTAPKILKQSHKARCLQTRSLEAKTITPRLA